MIPNIPSLSPLFEFVLPRNISGTDFGTGYGGTVCGFHTRPQFIPFPPSLDIYIVTGTHMLTAAGSETSR